MSLEGLGLTLERVLALFEAYPDNRAILTAKRGPDPAARFPRDFDAKVMKDALGSDGPHSCIHCHHVHDAMNEIAARAADYEPRRLLRHPEPEGLGLKMNAKLGRKVSKVESDSPAARAGLKPGDEIVLAGGQAITSLADLRFVLHHLGEPASLKLRLRRGKQERDAALELGIGWKQGDLSWRASLYTMKPRAGLWIAPLGKEKRAQLGIADKSLALEVRGLFAAPVKRAGLRVGDVIVEADGRKDPWKPAEFHAWLRETHYRDGAKMRLTVRRGTERETVTVSF